MVYIKKIIAGFKALLRRTSVDDVLVEELINKAIAEMEKLMNKGLVRLLDFIVVDMAGLEDFNKGSYDAILELISNPGNRRVTRRILDQIGRELKYSYKEGQNNG